MALFEYFPNYIWNLSVAMALESGAQIGEIVDMCQPRAARMPERRSSWRSGWRWPIG
jgi:hypothetical protein